MSQDKAETGHLQELLSRVGASLDDYLKFEQAVLRIGAELADEMN